MRILIILLFTFSLQAQTITDTEKQKWMARDGKRIDGGFNLGYNFLAWFANGTQEQRYAEVQAVVNELLNGESWYGGNRANAVIAAQLYFWYGNKLRNAEKFQIEARLKALVQDKYYFGIGTSNTGLNCFTARYIMAQHDKNAVVVYNDVGNTFGPPNFTYNGKTYTRGQTYNSYELSRDFIFYWMDQYINAGYLHGELFSEIYGFHFLNCLVTLADTRMVQDAEMRKRARMISDFFLLEHVVNTNGHHQAAPLGRSYMQLHLDGTRHLFYWDVYWGQMYPTHYGHPDGPFISDYRITKLMEDVGIYTDEPADYFHVVRSNVQNGRNVFIAKDFTLGSNPDDGNWVLEINGNDQGAQSATRKGFPFRIWLNEHPKDLDPVSCTGECYSVMGTHGHQYKNAIFVKQGSAILHEAIPGSAWDVIETSGAWRFSREGNVGVAINRGGSSAALEVVRIGIDYPTWGDFKSAIFGKAKLEGEAYVTSKGDRIEARFNPNTRRLETWVLDSVGDYWIGEGIKRIEVVANLGEKVVEWNGRVLVVKKHGKMGRWDFNTWSYIEGGDVVAPAPPKGFIVTQ